MQRTSALLPNERYSLQGMPGAVNRAFASTIRLGSVTGGRKGMSTTGSTSNAFGTSQRRRAIQCLRDHRRQFPCRTHYG